MFFLVPAYPGCPGQKAVKWLCVRACVRVGKPSAASKSGQMHSEQDATEPLLRSLRSHLAMLVYHA